MSVVSGVTPPDRSGTLARRLSRGDATAIVISNVIGGGILTTPALVAVLAPHPPAMLAAWGVGGVLAWAGATAYAELAARYPRAGGEYVYIREAFGPLAAFLTGWTSFIAGFSGAIAANAVAAAILASRLVPGYTTLSIVLPLPSAWETMEIPLESLLAVALVLALSLIHSVGLTVGRLVQNSLAVAKVVCLTLVAVGGVWLGHGPIAAPAANGTVGGWWLALIPVMFSYSGWNAATYVAEEVRRPRRNVPLALWTGTAIVVALYLMVNFAYLCGPTSERSTTFNVAEPIARQLLGPAGGIGVTLLTILILLSSTSAMVLTGPRVYFAMAQDGLFFSAAARIHPRFRTPAIAILCQAACSIVLALTGTFERLVTYTGFAVVLFSGVAAAALLVLRRRALPDRSPGWRLRRLAPVVFVAAAAAITANALYAAPRQFALGVMVIAAGVPLYRVARRTHQTAPIRQGGHDESRAFDRGSAHC